MRTMRMGDAPDYAPAATLRQFLTILAWTGLGFGLLLGHLNLRFALDDARRETSKLQSRQLDLRGKIHMLRGEVEARKKGDHLLRYAEASLGMVPRPAGPGESIRIDRRILDKYEGIQLARSLERKRPTEESADTAEAWLKLLASKTGLDGAAFAGGPSPER